MRQLHIFSIKPKHVMWLFVDFFVFTWIYQNCSEHQSRTIQVNPDKNTKNQQAIASQVLVLIEKICSCIVLIKLSNNTMYCNGMKLFTVLAPLHISRSFYNFYPIFHYGLYSNGANITDNLYTKQGNSSKKSTVYNQELVIMVHVR